MNYISISPFWVFEMIEKNTVIYVANKQSKEIFILNDIDVGTAVELIKDAKKHSDKYDFWYEESEEKVNETV